jgi:hypothetical protein
VALLCLPSRQLTQECNVRFEVLADSMGWLPAFRAMSASNSGHSSGNRIHPDLVYHCESHITRGRKMTEADTIEVAAICAANSFTAFTIYISFTFGFLATAFFVGNKLTRFQVLAATGMYLIAAGATALAMLIWLKALFLVLNDQNTVLNSLPFLNENAWIGSMSIISIGGILVSSYFMWGVRHPKTE